MGLDFTIYKRKKTESIDKILDNLEENELCYGRKSWELVRYLGLPTDTTEAEVPQDRWTTLISKLKDFLKANNLKSFSEVGDYYQKIDSCRENDFPIPEKYIDIVTNYEVWHSKVFDEYPQLGYEFATGYLDDFYFANDTVMQYFNNPDYEVWAEISF